MWYGTETFCEKQTLRWIIKNEIFDKPNFSIETWYSSRCDHVSSFSFWITHQVCPNFAVTAALHIETIFMKIIIAMEICHYCRFEIWYLVENHILIRADTSGHPIPDEMKIEYFYAPKNSQPTFHYIVVEWMCQKFKTIKKSSGKFFPVGWFNLRRRLIIASSIYFL